MSKIAKNIIKILIVFLSWRFFLQLVAMTASCFFSFAPSYPYYFDLLARFAPWWAARWAGFDGVHYLTIAMKGYIGTGLIQAFFPVYPKLIAMFNVFANPLVIGLIMSHVFAFLSLILLIKLYTKQEYGTQPWKLILGFLLFPTSFFFISLYAESIFLFLALLTFYVMEKKQWIAASVITAFASATKITGIFLIPALMLAIYQDYKTRNKSGLPWKYWAISLLGVTGLVMYMIFLYSEFKDPLYFLHVQSEFGAGRQEQLILFPQVIFRYIKMLFTADHYTWLYFSYTQELVITLIAGAVLFTQTFLKNWKMKTEYLIFS